MSSKSKKQKRRAYNKKTSKQRTISTKKRGSASMMNATKMAKSAEINEKIKQETRKRRFKDFGVIAVCVIMVLAFAIPSGIAAISSANNASAQQEEAQEQQAAAEPLTHSEKESIANSGKFSQFLLVDREKGITVADLYDAYVTPDEQTILTRMEAEGITAADIVNEQNILANKSGATAENTDGAQNEAPTTTDGTTESPTQQTSE